jgi:hypothetical protein
MIGFLHSANEGKDNKRAFLGRKEQSLIDGLETVTFGLYAIFQAHQSTQTNYCKT